MNMKQLLKISRPRFWLYLTGPYLIGLAAAGSTAQTLSDVWIWVFLFYFLFPANIFIYGINDIYDYETDKLNPKKTTYEHLVTPDLRLSLSQWILGTNILFWILAFGFPLRHMCSMLGFIVFGLFYSAPPIRAKTKPLLDSAFNILYLFPGWFGFYLAGGTGFNWHIFLAGALWVMAMHAYSAVPDIEADAKAGIHTIATTLGKTGTLLFCLICYVTAALISVQYLVHLAMVAGGVYAVLMLMSLMGKQKTWVFQVYKWFPVINATLGFSIFLYIYYA